MPADRICHPLSPRRHVDPLAVVMQTTADVVKSGANVSGKVEGLEGRNFALFLFSEGGGATNLQTLDHDGRDGTASFEFNLTLEAKRAARAADSGGDGDGQAVACAG